MTNKFRMMLLSMAAVGIVGCADKLSEDFSEGVDPTTTEGSEGSVTFKISTVATRADEPESVKDWTDGFDAGDEYYITAEPGSNVVFLFDEAGKYQGRSDLQVLSDVKDITEGANDNHSNNDGEKYFNARIRKPQHSPTLKCILILNANPKELRYPTLDLVEGETTLEDFYKETSKLTNSTSLGQFIDSDNKLCYTMSNTVFVKETNNELGEIHDTFSITDRDIFTTAKEAKEHPIIVHVERLAAKFGLTFYKDASATEKEAIYGQNQIIYMNDNLNVLTTSDLKSEIEQRSWAVKILGWNVNAKEKETYWVKRLKPIDGNYVWDDNGFIGKWNHIYSANGWNDPTRMRSYWAVDPHYNNNTDRYPMQYRQASDVDGVVSDNEAEAANDALTYINYKDVVDNTINAKTYRYAPENTFGVYSKETGSMTAVTGNPEQYTGDGYMRVGTHILVAAKLLIADEEGSAAVDGKDVDIYCYENIYWKDADVVKEIKVTENGVETTKTVTLNGKEELIKYMVNNVLTDLRSTVYIDEKENGVFTGKKIELTADKANDYFALDAPATIKGGDGRLMLRVKETIYRYVQTEGGEYVYEPIAANDPQLMNVIYMAGTAKHYAGGKMYYAVPIKHMAPVYREKIDDSETYKYTYNTGSYGVVRNHWYAVNISSIKKPGTPVDDEDQPIIPNEDPDEGGYIAFEIVVVPWHVINQNVEF